LDFFILLLHVFDFHNNDFYMKLRFKKYYKDNARFLKFRKMENILLTYVCSIMYYVYITHMGI